MAIIFLFTNCFKDGSNNNSGPSIEYTAPVTIQPNLVSAKIINNTTNHTIFDNITSGTYTIKFNSAYKYSFESVAHKNSHSLDELNMGEKLYYVVFLSNGGFSIKNSSF